VIVKRVSSPDQGDGPSLDEQGKQTKELVMHFDGEIVAELEFEESATTLEKEHFNKILELAKEDEFDVLAVAQLNRLTRADPWEAIDFMRTLYRNDVYLCTAENGPYEWDDVDDFDEITTEIVLARKHVLDIKEGQKRNWRPEFQQKRWPQGTQPPTLMKLVDTDEDYDELRLKRGAKKVATRLYDKYIETENMSEAQEHIEQMLPIGEVESLSYSQVVDLFGDRQLTGRFPKSGEVLAEHEDLRVVSDEKYEKVVELREENRAPEQENPLESTDALSAHAQRFGPLHTLLNVLTRFRPICENCGSIMEWDGNNTGQSMGITVPKFECTGCDQNRTIPSKEAMTKMTDVLPLRCPHCPGTETFTVEEIKSVGAVFDYQYTCDVCGRSWGSDMGSNKIRRVFDHPKLKFSIDDESLKPDTQNVNNNQELGDFV
jgi:hypothetical protein